MASSVRHLDADINRKKRQHGSNSTSIRCRGHGEAIATPTPHDNFREMRQHIMPEVAWTQITVTKKATVIKLEQQPPIENNNLQEEFIKAPGLLVTEQHTPGQFNFSYRGLGNPQESAAFRISLTKNSIPESSSTVRSSRPRSPPATQAWH
jgi:hypothetical protein